DTPLATLLVPADLPKHMQYRLDRLVPSLEALLAAARDREAINAELEASRNELERFFDLTSDLFFIGDGTRIRRQNAYSATPQPICRPGHTPSSSIQRIATAPALWYKHWPAAAAQRSSRTAV